MGQICGLGPRLDLGVGQGEPKKGKPGGVDTNMAPGSEEVAAGKLELILLAGAGNAPSGTSSARIHVSRGSHVLFPLLTGQPHRSPWLVHRT